MSIIKSKMSLQFVFRGQWATVGLRIWTSAQLVSGSSAKRSALTRKSLTIWSTCNRGKEGIAVNLWPEAHYRSSLMDVSLSQIQCCRETWMGLCLRRFFSWTLLILAGPRVLMLARHWESRLRVPPPHSHTYLDGKCVLAVWQKLVRETWSTARKKNHWHFARNENEPEL